MITNAPGNGLAPTWCQTISWSNGHYLAFRTWGNLSQIFFRNSHILIEEIAFETAVWVFAPEICRPRWVKPVVIIFHTHRSISDRCTNIESMHWGVVFFLFRFLASKNIFNLCPHIELNTQITNPIFKITIHCTK